VLKQIAKDFKQLFSPAAACVIFDRGAYEIIDIIGDCHTYGRLLKTVFVIPPFCSFNDYKNKGKANK